MFSRWDLATRESSGLFRLSDSVPMSCCVVAALRNALDFPALLDARVFRYSSRLPFFVVKEASRCFSDTSPDFFLAVG